MVEKRNNMETTYKCEKGHANIPESEIEKGGGKVGKFFGMIAGSKPIHRVCSSLVVAEHPSEKHD